MRMMVMKTHDQRSAGILRDQRQQHQQVVPQLTLMMTETLQEQMEKRILQRSAEQKKFRGHAHVQLTQKSFCIILYFESPHFPLMSCAELTVLINAANKSLHCDSCLFNIFPVLQIERVVYTLMLEQDFYYLMFKFLFSKYCIFTAVCRIYWVQ